MLKNKILIGLTALGLSANAQWMYNGVNIYNSNIGSVGIGNASNFNGKLNVSAINDNNIALRIDFGKFSMGGSADFGLDAPGVGNGRFLIKGNGLVGIGHNNPQHLLHIGNGNVFIPAASGGNSGNLYLGGITDQSQNGLRFFTANGASYIDVKANSSYDGLIFRIDNSQGGTERMRISANGSVGIGTATPNTNYRLDVIGNLHVDGRIDTRDVCVTPNSFCDYVFDENYKLLGLDSLKSYISKNKHLPHFPSEKQLVKNGMSITDITLSQTRTIEELVLYTSKQEEKMQTMQAELEELKKLLINK